ncbi:MAG: hypothetical protein WKF93_11535 [Acidimicrobiales bacterium]
MLLSELLITQDRGAIDREAGAALTEVATAVDALDRAGSLTVELKLSKQAGRIVVVANVKPKAPIAPSAAALYFVGDDGLTKDDPKQLTLEGMRRLPEDEAPRTVDADTGEVTG